MNINISGNNTSNITTQDEGVLLSSSVNTLNFTGAGVTASGTGSTTTINIPGGGGGGSSFTTGETTLDFGAFPGSSDASIIITGQTGILSTSYIEAWLFPKDTADHLADEHIYENIKVVACNIVAGTGFTIYAVNTNQINEPILEDYGVSVSTLAGSILKPSSFQTHKSGGKGTLIYGLWTIRWRWT